MKQLNIQSIVLRMTGKHPFVLVRLPTELNHILLLKIMMFIVLTLHYAKIMKSLHNRKATDLGLINYTYLNISLIRGLKAPLGPSKLQKYRPNIENRVLGLTIYQNPLGSLVVMSCGEKSFVFFSFFICTLQILGEAQVCSGH